MPGDWQSRLGSGGSEELHLPHLLVLLCSLFVSFARVIFHLCVLAATVIQLILTHKKNRGFWAHSLSVYHSPHTPTQVPW